MSADNWRVCPRCYQKAKQDQTEAQNRANEAYGKVPREEYAKLVEKAQQEVSPPETLGEYRHIGITKEGVFYVIYNAGCRQCGFTYEFEHDEQLEA